MTSFLARIGQANTHRTANLIWKSGRRKAVSWTVGRSAESQQRSYGDDRVRWTAGGITFPEEDESVKREERQAVDQKTPLPTDKVRRQNHTSFWEQETAGDAFSDQRAPEEQRYEPIRPQGEAGDIFEHDGQLDKIRSEMSMKTQMELASRNRDVLWEQFEEAEDAEAESANVEAPSEDTEAVESPADTSRLDSSRFDGLPMLDVNYRDDLPLALSLREADKLTRCLFAAQKAGDMDFIGSIPEATFSEIIEILDPSNFVAKLASTHVELSASLANSFGLAPMPQVAHEYSLVLRRVVILRRAAGVKLTLEDYTALLRHARDLGNRKMGHFVWKTMLEDDHQPTTECYNHLMSVEVWDGVHRPGFRQRARIIPFNTMSRQRQQRETGNYNERPVMLRTTVKLHFNRMIIDGAIANEESFRILITACAREGDIETAKTVMKQVWRIDVDGIVSGKDESEIQPKAMQETSTLRPTVGLLWTIAHAFGINNDIPAALRVVDFVARNYQLQVSDEVWSQLFEWTFVLSAHRAGAALRNGSTAGQLPKSSVLNLWETMTGPPYLVQPSMGMYNKLIRNLSQRSWAPKIAEYMRKGAQLYEEHRIEALYSSLRFDSGLSRQKSSPGSESIETLRNEFEYRETIRRRDVFWLRRWCHLYLKSFRDWHMIDHSHGSTTRELPTVLWEFRRWILYVVRYETATGFIEFDPWTKEQRRQRRARGNTRARERQRAIDEARKFVGHDWLFGRERAKWEPREEYRRRKQGLVGRSPRYAEQ